MRKALTDVLGLCWRHQSPQTCVFCCCEYFNANNSMQLQIRGTKSNLHASATGILSVYTLAVRRKRVLNAVLSRHPITHVMIPMQSLYIGKLFQT